MKAGGGERGMKAGGGGRGVGMHIPLVEHRG